ncbi:hypothetical protein EDB80DRAFT_736123 [Ilyonectria destructans]|nr:hypothetical protein EDB80DRAFT_736123 [Ilyonectria destructans]
MPGNGAAEVNRLIGGTLLAFQNTTDTCHDIDKAKDLPSAFHEVFQAVAPVKNFLEGIKLNVVNRNSEESFWQEIKPAMQVCRDNATRLDEIFFAVVPEGNGTRQERYRNAAGKRDRVEDLMKILLKFVVGLAEKPDVGEVARSQLEELQNFLLQISALSPSLPDDETCQYSFHNSGAGWMNVNTGNAPQHNNNASGIQFNGPVEGLQLSHMQPYK